MPRTRSSPLKPLSPDRPRATTLPGRWRQAWERSLGFRLLALGLMPLLLAFPIVIAVLIVVGGARTQSMVESHLRSNLAGSVNYLEQLRNEAGTSTRQLASSERLMNLVDPRKASKALDEALSVMARSAGLDFLIVASPDGRVIGSSSRLPFGTVLPDSYVLRQARTGVG
ncbi:MAG: hypothetical protein VW687_04790, partial [Curvibacter sp.]